MYKIIVYIVVGFGLVFGYVKYIELKGIFFPTKNIEFNPNFINLTFEDVYIKTADNLKINGWFIPHLQQGSVSLEQEGAGFIPHDNAKYTLLLFHGNAGNIQDRLEKISLLRQAALNIFIIDYRGYGRSQGRPSENGLYLDAKSAYNYLLNTRKISSDQIILYGESIGTTVAINLASEFQVKAVILEGAFSCGRDMARAIYPFLPTFLFSNKFDSLEKIKKVKAHKLFIHSRDDEIVSFNLAQKLYRAASEPKQFVEITGGHNTAFFDSSSQCIASIIAFIERL